MYQLSERYCYAKEGARVRKVTPYNQQQTCYLPGLEIHSLPCGGRRSSPLSVMILPGVRIGRRHQGKAEKIPAVSVHYSSHDRTGSTVMAHNAEAQLISRETFYPFGGTALWATRKQLTCQAKTHRYANKERDSSGLIYYGYRYYASWLLRWLNTDPSGTVDGLNLYQMVKNSPLTWTDNAGCVAMPPPVSSLAQRITMTSQVLKRHITTQQRTTLKAAIPAFNAVDEQIMQHPRQDPGMCEFAASEILIKASVPAAGWLKYLSPRTQQHQAINALLNPEWGEGKHTERLIAPVVEHLRNETQRAPLSITAYGCAHPTSKYDRHHAVVMLYADYIGREAGALLVDRDDTRRWQGVQDAYRVVNLAALIKNIFTCHQHALNHYEQNRDWKTDPLLDRPRGPFVKTIIHPLPIFSLTSAHRKHYRDVIAQCLKPAPCWG